MAAVSHGAEHLASGAYPRRDLRLILTFALLSTLFDGAEVNLVGYPLGYLSDSLHVSMLALISVATFQGFASIAGGFLFGWLGDTLGRRCTYALSVWPSASPPCSAASRQPTRRSWSPGCSPG